MCFARIDGEAYGYYFRFDCVKENSSRKFGDPKLAVRDIAYINGILTIGFAIHDLI